MADFDEDMEDTYEEEPVEQPQPQSPSPFRIPFLQPQPQPAQQEPEPVAEHKPRTDMDTALDAEDEEEIFGTGEREDGSIDELERDDVDDIIDVDIADVTGYPEDKPQKQRFARTAKKYRPNNQPPATMGGMQV